MYSPPYRLRIDALSTGDYPPLEGIQRLDTVCYRTYYPKGVGYLAGSFPDGITSVEGVPAPATIKVLLRDPGHETDGVAVAETTSAPDGTWLVEGLDRHLKYDVICRHEGYNDMILTNVSPHSLPHLHDAYIQFDIGVPSDHTLLPYAGTAPYTVELKSGVLPEGVTLVDNVLVGDWPTGQAGGYQVVLTVTDSVGGKTDRTMMVWLILQPLVLTKSHDVPESYLVDRPIVPVIFEAHGGEAPYTFSVIGELPNGLTLDANTGELSGTPSTLGNFSFGVSVVDSRGGEASLLFDVTVGKQLTVINPHGELGTTGWTTTLGTLLTRTTDRVTDAPNSASDYVFYSRDAEDRSHQDIELPLSLQDVTGLSARVEWGQISWSGHDGGEFVVSFLDDASNIISTSSSGVTIGPATQNITLPFEYKQFDAEIPVGARVVRIEQHRVRGSGTDSNWEIQNISLTIVVAQ